MTNRDRIQLHLQWWDRTNPRPLMDNFLPLKLPYGGLDLDVPVDQIGERKRADAEAIAIAAQDLLVTQRIDFGPAFLPALAGAGFAHDRHTSWNTPVAACCADVKFPSFNPDQPLWVQYAARRAELLIHWSWDTYLPGHTNNIGPFDILAGLMGSENLVMQLYDDPEGVAALSMQAADFLAAVMRDEVNALRGSGPTEGTTDYFRIWLPGDGTRFVEDFTALISPDHTREFIVPASRRATRDFDSILYHTHSAAWQNVPTMAALGGHLAVEFGTDPGGPDLDTRIATVQKLQAMGLPVQYGSWNHPLTDDEIRKVVDGLNPQGLMLRFQCQTLDESQRLYDKITSPA